MAAALSKAERVRRALRGDEVDRVPISFWRHFPGQDHTAALLAERTLEFQREYDLDLVKLMPTGMYSIQDYGSTLRPQPGEVGTTEIVESAVKSPDDWERLRAVDPGRGVLGQQVECVRLVRAALGPEVPILQTVFDPLSMAAKLAGGDFRRHLAEHVAPLAAGLERMADDVLAFGRACLAAGADGFFFATQTATPQAMPAERYRRLGLPTARRVAEGLRDGAWLLLFHLHGPQPFFDLADELPVDAVNWHDRETVPDLHAAATRTRRALAAGIHRRGPAGRGEPAAAAAEVRDAIAQTGGRGLIVAPGCVLPYTAPESGLRAARMAVEQG